MSGLKQLVLLIFKKYPVSLFQNFFSSAQLFENIYIYMFKLYNLSIYEHMFFEHMLNIYYISLETNMRNDITDIVNGSAL